MATTCNCLALGNSPHEMGSKGCAFEDTEGHWNKFFSDRHPGPFSTCPICKLDVDNSNRDSDSGSDNDAPAGAGDAVEAYRG